MSKNCHFGLSFICWPELYRPNKCQSWVIHLQTVYWSKNYNELYDDLYGKLGYSLFDDLT